MSLQDDVYPSVVGKTETTARRRSDGAAAAARLSLDLKRRGAAGRKEPSRSEHANAEQQSRITNSRRVQSDPSVAPTAAAVRSVAPRCFELCV